MDIKLSCNIIINYSLICTSTVHVLLRLPYETLSSIPQALDRSMHIIYPADLINKQILFFQTYTQQTTQIIVVLQSKFLNT